MKKILLIVETITIIFLLLILASKNSKNQVINEAKDDRSDVSPLEETKNNEVFRELSPDGDYGLVIFEIGSPGFAFGNDKLKITLYEVLAENEIKADYYRASFEAEVANDGATAIFNVEWLEDGVQICLEGEEQPTAYYILPYKNNTSGRD